jgi:hypothetical protein
MMLPRAVGTQGRTRGQPERGSMNTRARRTDAVLLGLSATRLSVERDDDADGGLRSA